MFLFIIFDIISFIKYILRFVCLGIGEIVVNKIDVDFFGDNY